MKKSILLLFLSLSLGLMASLPLHAQKYIDYLNEGHDYFNKGNYEEAVSSYSMSIYYKSANPKAFYWRGIAQWFLKHYRSCASDLQSAVDKNHANKGRSYYWMADSYYKVKEYQRAYDAYRNSVRYDDCPNPETARQKIDEIKSNYLTQRLSGDEHRQNGHNKYNQEDYAGAVKDYTKAIQANAYDKDALYWRSMSYWYLKDYQNTIRDIDKAISYGYKNKGSAYYWKARAEYNTEQYQTSIRNFDNAIRNNYKYLSYAYLYRGYANWYLDKWSQAAIDLQKCLDNKHENKGDAYYWMADAQYRAQKYQQAAINYQKSLENDCPHPDTAREKIDEINANYIGGNIEIAWTNPTQSSIQTRNERINLKACIQSDLGVRKTQLYVNGQYYDAQGEKGFTVVSDNSSCDLNFEKNIKLEAGINKLKLVVTDNRGNQKTSARSIQYNAPQKQRTAKVWAVVVGVASYSHIQSLRYSDDDAYQMYAFLKSPEGGAIPDEQIAILIDEHATRERILATLREKFQKASPNDLILFYFSGHGTEGAFVPFNYDGSEGSKLSHSDIQRIFKSSLAKNKLCIADACHSGSLNRGERSASVMEVTSNYYNALAGSQGGMALMMSSKAEETSIEFQGLRQGVFSHYLIKGLKGSADRNRDKLVSVQELYDYARKETQGYTNFRQNPELHGSFDNNMPVGAVRQ